MTFVGVSFMTDSSNLFLDKDLLPYLDTYWIPFHTCVGHWVESLRPLRYWNSIDMESQFDPDNISCTVNDLHDGFINSTGIVDERDFQGKFAYVKSACRTT